MISPGAQPTTLGWVWTGETCPTPELLAQALGDPEDRPPLRRSDHDFCTCWQCTQPNWTELDLLTLTMPNDQEDRDEARDRDTNPASAEPPSEGETTRTDNARPALVPPALPAERMRELAVDELLKMHKTVAAGLQELLAPDGRLAKQTEAIAAAIDRAAERTNGTYELLRGELKSFREATQAKDADHDQQIAELRKQIEAIQTKMAADRREFEGKFAEQQACLDEVNRILGTFGYGPPAESTAPTG
jgi:hypothetical protein